MLLLLLCLLLLLLSLRVAAWWRLWPCITPAQPRQPLEGMHTQANTMW